MGISQRDVIADWLLAGHSITNMEASEKFGVCRLSSIIYDLRHKRKMNILSREEQCINRYGTQITYDRFYYDGEIE